MIVRLLDPSNRERDHFDVEVAMTDRARTKGLSGRSNIGDGMIFFFPRPTVVPFTVAKMKVPIDIAWLDDQGRILGIARKLDPGSRFLARATAIPYCSALEVPSGRLSEAAGTGWRLVW